MTSQYSDPAKKDGDPPSTASISPGLHFSNRMLAWNTFYNFLGRILPLLVGIITIPILIRKLGLERYGFLTLAWSVIGYFGLFDLGVGRATTKFVAEYLALHKTEELPALIWTAILMLFGFGLLGGGLAFITTPLLVDRIFNISLNLHGETRQALHLLSASIPFVLTSAGACGVLEAQQRFGLINAIRIPASISNFLAPVVVSFFSISLYPVVASVVFTRLLGCLAFFYFCLESLPGMKRPQLPLFLNVKKLLGFGGWLTVSNIVGPIMVYSDRFFIGALLTMEAVAYYVTPYDLVTKLWIIPGSLVPVLFPAFSTYAAEHQDKLTVLQHRAVKFTVLALTPVTVCVIILGGPFLTIWLGSDFAKASTPILQLLAVGVLINSAAWIPYSAIQAMGRPDLVAKLHLLELPIFLGLIWLSIIYLGLLGVALTWLLRAIATTAVVFWMSHRLMSVNTQILVGKKLGFILGATILVIGVLFLAIMPNLTAKIILLPVILIGLGMLAWRYVLDELDKGQFYLIKAKLFKFLI